MEEARRRPPWPWVAALAVLALAGATLAVVLLTGDDEASAQTIRFQKPTDAGPDPFTKPADRRGRRSVRLQVGQGPFGGTGSDLVCDRELLIRSLRARPDRLAEWARVVGIEPEIAVVARYIRRLRPVTLTTDTRVTNHSFVDGRAVAFQAILQAGTAVLVDADGVPVARCRCGNPLLKPIEIVEAKCFGCPPNYRPPPPCEYFDYDDSDYRRYGDAYFLRTYRRSDYEGICYVLYPDPPRVRPRYDPDRRPPPTDVEQATNPSASFSPSAGTTNDTYTLFASGFRPNVTLSVRLTRPDGAGETYSITTNAAGSGSYTFPRVGDAVLGTYTATVTDPGSGDSASASTTVSAPQQAPPDDGGLQCDPARSQLEAEQCAELEGNAPQPAPDPNYDCPDQPPASPGEDYLRNCPAQ